MAFDFSAIHAPFRMQPGLRRLAPGAHQLTANQTDSRALREKLAALSASHPLALQRATWFDAAPALQALVRHAGTEQPHALVVADTGQIEAPLLGWAVCGDEVHGNGPPDIGTCLRSLPSEWRLAGLLSLAFAEDFAIIDGDTGHIPWLAVCLPSSWAPEDKVGRHFAEVHSPVADNQVLIAASAHLAQLVTGAERWERFVWTITPRDSLQAHPRRVPRADWPAGADAATLAKQAYLRTERQTFIPVATHRQAIFTIHVDVQPLAAAVETVDQARRLHDALASMSANVLAYRGLSDARDRLLKWLRLRAAHPDE